MILAEISDKVPSVEATAALGGLLAVASMGLALHRWWIGGLLCLCACALLLVSAYQDLTDSTLRPLIAAELGDHYTWARVAAAAMPLLAVPGIVWAWMRSMRRAGKGAGGQTGYQDCKPCGQSIPKPAGLSLPPIDL